MQEINVFITEDSNGKSKIGVDQPMVGVHRGDTVLWSFHSVVKDKVLWAELDFEARKDDNQRAEFFECRGRSHAEPRCYAEVRNGHGHLVGTAPGLGKPDSKKNKYWIRGYATEPIQYDPTNAVCELDPDVIICDP